MTTADNLQADPARDRRADRLWTLACAVVTLLAILSIQPFSNVPRSDDFSYARTAAAFAQTGHMVYNGWGSPMLIPQAVVGGLLIRIFGFSYNLLDGVGVACAGGVAALLFMLGRQCRLSRPFALLATLAVVGSPMFLGCAPTYMTDGPSLLLSLVALLFLLRSVAPKQATVVDEPATALALDRRAYMLFVVASIVAGSNRQISWAACAAAALPLLFALRNRADRLWVAGGIAAIVAVGAALTAWWSAQPFIVPTDTASYLLLLVGYPEVALPMLYKFYAILGIFMLPFAVLALRRSDFRKLSFWTAMVLGVAPLAVPTSKFLSCFNPYLGILAGGQYFTSCGTRTVYLKGATDLETTVFSPFLVSALMVSGALCLGFSLYLIITGLGATLRPRTGESIGERYRYVAAASLCFVSLAQAIISVPWLAGMHGTDRYFIFLVPGYALFFLTYSTLRVAEKPRSASYRVVAGVSFAWVVALSLVGYAFATTFLHCSSAQAVLYHRLRAAGALPGQIDNGFEEDADAQVVIAGHMNYQSMLPKSAFDPDARGKNLTSPTPQLFPAVNARYILSLDPAPATDFALDPKPVDQQTYTRLIPPFHLTVYALRVLPDGQQPAAGAPGVGTPPTGAP